MNTFTTKLKALPELPEEIQDLYSSTQAAARNKKIKQKFDFSESEYDGFLEVTGDVIFGFNKVSELPDALVQIGFEAEKAKQITSELLEFLGPVIEAEKNGRTTRADVVTGEDLEVAVENPTDTTPPPELVTEAPIETTEEAASVLPPAPPETVVPVEAPEEPIDPTAVRPLRTMAEDMKAVHGYGALQNQDTEPEPDDDTPVHSSSQDQVIERPSLVEKPTYTTE